VANSDFTIQTLAADGETPVNPVLVLGGRALPYQGLELETSMRADFTWYPGNAVATVQMIGAQVKPTPIKGMWKDKFIRPATDEGRLVQPEGVALFNSQQATSVLELTRLVDKMCLTGQLLRVTWGGLVRHGIMTNFRQNWMRVEDVEWGMEFSWISRGEVQSPPSIQLQPDTNSFVVDLRSTLNALKDAVADLRDGLEVADSFVAKVNSAIRTVDDGVSELEGAVENAVRLVASPLAATQRALSVAQTVKDSAAEIVAYVDSYPPLELIRTGDPSTLTLAAGLRADTYSRAIKQQARQLQSTASAQGDTLRAGLEQDMLLAAFVARSAMDLREVSQRYYGTPDEWGRLLDYNDMDTSLLRVGQLVLVPKLSA
jgi:hypothetical protein